MKLTAGYSFRCADVKEAQDAVGRALLGVLPHGAESVVLRMGVLTVAKSGSTKAYFPDGSSKGLKMGGRFDTALLDRMRETMYRDDSGTWFSFEMTVTATGGMTVRFNYDDEPDFGPEGLDPVAYVNDAKNFPRDEAHQPEWLKQRLAEGPARLT
ncbi:antitoxin YezG family protein [Sinomonas albida]|uniref:immunity protein YezG family protein n=1 Tax=Sinomonas albida TaxID=369942 RepID=UPI0010A7CD0C|nr:immunity protein YezG family protein [Sinomonas albida]